MSNNTKAKKATTKASAKAPKTLGRIAYDSSPHDGGKANFGPWSKAPQLVRDVHERMAKAVEREVRKRTKDEILPKVEALIMVFSQICDMADIDTNATMVRVKLKKNDEILVEKSLAEICKSVIDSI